MDMNGYPVYAPLTESKYLYKIHKFHAIFEEKNVLKSKKIYNKMSNVDEQ